MALDPVIALRSKVGELEALRHTHEGVQPMVELLDSLDDDRGRLLPMLVDAAVALVEDHRSLWVDAHWLTAASGLRSTPGGAFEQVDGMVEQQLNRRSGLFAPDVPAIIPVIGENASNEVLGSVMRLREHHDRPVVVRVRDLALPSAELASRIARVVELTAVDPAHLHAVVDVGYVAAVTPLLIRTAVDSVRAAADLGSVTLLAGSVPDKRTTYDTKTHDRPELDLWHEVISLAESPVRYGDYGVAHPAGKPQSTSEVRQPHPYLYYTIAGRRIALRRNPNRESAGTTPAANFAELAGELVRLPDFAGRGYSWGDEHLEMCGRGAYQAGTSSRWIAMATSHHIRHITSEAVA